MASAMIHICVAKKLNEKIKTNEKQLFLGTIAPDISKHVGENKNNSHFLFKDNSSGIPDLDKFLNKYQILLKNPFELGYYIHLYTDKLWVEKFLSNIILDENIIKDINGKIIEVDEDKLCELIYNDYTTLNSELIDTYDLDLSLFYEPFLLPDIHIEEIPRSKIQLIIDQMGIIVKNAYEGEKYLFNIDRINAFVEECVDEIYDNLISLGISI